MFIVYHIGSKNIWGSATTPQKAWEEARGFFCEGENWAPEQKNIEMNKVLAVAPAGRNLAWASELEGGGICGGYWHFVDGVADLTPEGRDELFSVKHYRGRDTYPNWEAQWERDRKYRIKNEK